MLFAKPRVGVFVDTQNLYHSARDYYERTVNFETLLRYATIDRELLRAVSYVVEREGDTSAWPFIYKLSTLGYRVRRMNLTVHHTTDAGKMIWEGNWDMGICADMVRLADHLDVIVLGSGDGDFVDMLEVLMERGKRVEVVAFKETTSQKLIDTVDRFTHWPDVEGAFMPYKERGWHGLSASQSGIFSAAQLGISEETPLEDISRDSGELTAGDLTATSVIPAELLPPELRELALQDQLDESKE